MGSPLGSQSASRWGLHASRVGVGLDYALARGATLSADAWSLGDPRLDLNASFPISRSIEGVIGLDEAFHRNLGVVGLRYHFDSVGLTRRKRETATAPAPATSSAPS